MPKSSMLFQDPSAGPDSQANSEPGESFADMLSQYERTSSHAGEERRGFKGTVVAVNAESVMVDIGFKTEGILPLAEFTRNGETVQRGDMVPVSIKGRDPEGYYELSRMKVERPRDWSALEKAFADKAPSAGVVTAVVKGGVSVDVGVRAFMPASRSGAREAADLEKRSGRTYAAASSNSIRADGDVVVDRRAVLGGRGARGQGKALQPDQGRRDRNRHRAQSDRFRRFRRYRRGGRAAPCGRYFLGGVANRPTFCRRAASGAKVLKVDAAKRRIAIGLKQLQPHPWDLAADKYKVGDRVTARSRGWRVRRFRRARKGRGRPSSPLEMSWTKKVRKPSDVLKEGEQVEVAVLGVKPGRAPHFRSA